MSNFLSYDNQFLRWVTNLAAAGAAIMAEEKAVEHAIHDLAYQVPKFGEG